MLRNVRLCSFVAEETQTVSVPPRSVVRQCLGSWSWSLCVVAFFVFGKFGQFTRFLHFDTFGTHVIGHGHLVKFDDRERDGERVCWIAGREHEGVRSQEGIGIGVGIEDVHDAFLLRRVEFTA